MSTQTDLSLFNAARAAGMPATRAAHYAQYVRKCEAWEECFEAVATWTPSGPDGTPHDPPRNPYRSEADHG